MLFLILIFNEKSFAYGVAGQYVLNSVYQPSTYGVLILSSLALFVYRKENLSVTILILAASIHPTYIIHAFFLICGYLIYLLIYKEYKIFLKFLSFPWLYLTYSFIFIFKYLYK